MTGLEAIVAVYADWGIGARGTQPVVLRADRRHFRELTEGACVIVGRRTLADFPGGRPLRGRRCIVVTRQQLEIEGAQVAHSTGEALALCADAERCLVIGGDSVYRQFLPYTQTVHVTKIALTPQSDSYFADLDADPEWRCAQQSEPMTENGVEYRFCTYQRLG